MSTVFGESGPKNVEVLAHPARRQSHVEPPPPPPPPDYYDENASPTGFGGAGPKHVVEVLAHPTRRLSHVGPPAPATVGQGKRMSLDSEMAAAEAGDHFEMMPAPSQLPPAARTWPAAKAAFSPQLSGSGGGMVRKSARFHFISRSLPRACASRARWLWAGRWVCCFAVLCGFVVSRCCAHSLEF